MTQKTGRQARQSSGGGQKKGREEKQAQQTKERHEEVEAQKCENMGKERESVGMREEEPGEEVG